MAFDRFAEIAAQKDATRIGLLSENKPMEIVHKACPLTEDTSAPMATPKVMDTKEELTAALKKLREQYTPYLKNYAPSLPSCTESIEVTEFLLDGKEKITIPHYGGPLGNAKQTYEASFTLPEIPADKAVYICIGGADYEAGVYLNGECVGMHEGFFSPFSFEITELVHQGENELKIILKNDYIFMGNDTMGKDEPRICGDKLYAATGLGYDDPYSGWHHCPPGMGIYKDVRIEIRNRISITDLYVRPLPEEKKAELWVEVESADYVEKTPTFGISVYGQNFEKTLIKDMEFIPYFAFEKEGDTLKTIQNADGREPNLPVMHGSNIYRIMLDIDDVRLWDNDTPWLYQVQVSLYEEGELRDAKAQQFGMRSFTQDMEPDEKGLKGMFYLNGKKVRLRGANTMGYEQQDVLRKDFDTLIDDILLSKLCNMNYLRLTQRPVQDEVYAYCDMLGMMTQTDLPLFACMRRTKYAEGVRQAEEMIRMVRKHPCNIAVTYINEPSANAFELPHRNLLREEMETFFECCDNIVRMNAPDYVIKHVDGDYDAPTRNSIPDNHCYNLWYNGHNMDFGKMYRGYWKETAEGWYCGCGEYGAEGLDCREVMEKYYPKEWLAEPFTPGNILNAQSEAFHGYFFDTPSTMDEWIEATQAHQAFSAKMLTECFRRTQKMISCAIHLFIDAWPAGWMKSIMDFERNPKPAYFACRDAYAPILLTLRSDRFTYTSGEKIAIETYISNDRDEAYENCKVVYELYCGGKKVRSGETLTDIKACDVTYVADGAVTAEAAADREKYTLKAILLSSEGEVLSANTFDFEVFADVTVEEDEEVIFVADLTPGEHTVAGERVTVTPTGMGGRYFVSCQTGHEIVSDFQRNDFRYWYSKEEDMICHLTHHTFTADGFRPILACMNDGMNCVMAEKLHEGKRYVISTLHFMEENPVAKRLKKAIYDYHRGDRQ